MMHHAVSSFDPQFIMKADDDTYVNLPVVMNLLQHFPTDEVIYAGHQRCAASGVYGPCHSMHTSGFSFHAPFKVCGFPRWPLLGYRAADETQIVAGCAKSCCARLAA